MTILYIFTNAQNVPNIETSQHQAFVVCDHSRPLPMERVLALKAVVDLVPQWFTASGGGPFSNTLSLSGETLEFFSHRKPTPDLTKLIASVHSDLPTLMQV